MDASPRIAIDAMGGDVGPAAMLAGAARARRQDAKIRYIIFGDETAIRAELGRHGNLREVVTVIHTAEAIAPEEKPSQAIRRARTTSMGMAINAVKEGRADAAVSGGNTGAMMAMAKLALRTMPGIDRPALAALLPTLTEQDCVMLDLGANTECDAQNLVQFAVMGSAYARTVIGMSKPRVKLLNIGTEELKGTDELKEAAALLREADYLPMRFDGFTEGDQLSRGNIDVVVTDGFSGNIALKTAEGTARFVTDLLRRAFKSSLRSKAGFRSVAARRSTCSRSTSTRTTTMARSSSGLNGPGGEEPWRRQSQGRRQRHPRRRKHGAQRHHSQDRRRSRQFPRACLRDEAAQ
jgi:glycerol-3-phosphate acyltransferase PlsX